MLALLAAAVGATGIASALTPELASRSDLVRGVLPPGVPEAARIGAVAFGVMLLWLSRSLWRRRRRAWQLSVAIVLASTVAHLAKGLDVEEAVSSLFLLALLLGFRRRFDVPGDPRSVRPLALLALATAATCAAVAGMELSGTELPARFADFAYGVGLVAGLYGLFLWLRPLSQSVVQTVAERRLARALVDRYGRDSLSFFALRRDKSFFFSSSRRSFVAYRVVGGAALMSGDPVGDESEQDLLLEAFRRFAHANGWRFAVLGASSAAPYERLGLRAIPIGSEAVLDPRSFSLEGRAIRKVRQSVARLRKAGYDVRVLPADETSRAERAELDVVSSAWRGREPERGFSMAMDDLYAPGTLLVLAQADDGRLGGLLHLVPAGGGWSLSTMRRRPETPNGLTEFLIVETALWARGHGAGELSLNFCAFADLIEAGGPARRALRLADRLFQIERLYDFNRKFGPTWRPRYLCVETLGDLPRVGLAYLRVERLVPSPRWLRRVRVSH